ncbi:uncharacterized protein C15orf39 homolog isoform X1 [Engystomops pustulosus]|uniref:uncharacterized protein C15orf39 homolog isoform X1 n=1 Tax=Engystomops pustulosus TaxID=76066 RepID=UPI003AFA98C2
MAEKRHFGAVDHMIHNKLSRLEMASQRSTACFGIATTQDLQTCQNFISYPMPDSDGHASSSPWSSTTAYLQYAGSALSEHLQTREASLKCQRPQVERQHNPLQLSDNPNQGSVHHSPSVHGYHLSCPRTCPPIAMPRPVYRSPGNFIDASYGPRSLHPLGACVASQPLCPPAIEWNSGRFAPPTSPLYSPGTKKHLSTSSTYPEVAGSPSSLSRGLAEQNTVYRHRADMSLAVGVSSTYSKKDMFTDACHSVSQQNVQLLYSEGTVPLGRPRTSAFTTPSPKQKNNKPSSYQGNLDHRMGHLYSKNLYNNATNSIHQRLSPFSCSMDSTGSTHNVSGSSGYPNRAQHMHSGYMNGELRVQTSQLDGTLQPSDRAFQINKSMHKTVTEIPVCSPQRAKKWGQSGQLNTDLCGMSNRVDQEMFNSNPRNRSLQEQIPYRDPFTGQGSHAFVQKSRSSVIAPVVSHHEGFSGEHASRHSIRSEESSLNRSIHCMDDGRVSRVCTIENNAASHSSRTHTGIEHGESSVQSPSSASGIGSQYQMHQNNLRIRPDAAEQLPTNQEPPHNNALDADEPKSIPPSGNEDVENPKSPPMPVINDVFSLAPYRAYLEGKAPHPFGSHQESEGENLASNSAFTDSDERTGKAERVSSITKVVHAENKNAVKNQNVECVQNGEVSVENTGTESEVLDLSLKKLPQTGSSSGQQDNSYKNKNALNTVAAENCLGKAKQAAQGHDGYICTDNNRIFHLDHQENFPTQTSHLMVKLSQETCNPPSLSDNQNRLSEDLLCHRQKTPSRVSQASPWQLQENWQPHAAETHKSNLQESPMPSATNSLSSRHQERDYSQNAMRMPMQHQKRCPSQMIEHLSQHLRKKHQSQDNSKVYKFHDGYKSNSNTSVPCLPHDKYSSQVPESLPQQDLSSTRQTLAALPVHSSIQNPSCSGFSLLVNTMQTQTTLVPIILPSAPTVYFTNTMALHTPQPPPVEKPGSGARNPLESCHSQSSPSGSENESNGFHSSKSFMFRKYKMKRFSSSEEETHKDGTDSATKILPNPFSSETVQSLPPSAPESSPALGEANVSLASVGESSLSSSGKHFSELHRSVQSTITSAVARSSTSLLEDWLSKTKEEELSKAPVKTKNSFRSTDQSTDLPGHDIWLDFDGVRLLLHKLLSQLETFMFTRSCPFPHVIRAGAIFIPIHLVKGVLFPDLLGPSVDRILQKHKVELRPTTLSEEKLLRETELKTCSSRMLKLLALKQLPDVYPDLLCLFCRNTIQQELGKITKSLNKEKLKFADSPKKEPHSASPRKVKSSLIIKLQRVVKHSGIQVYKTQNPKTLQKKDKLRNSPARCKKLSRARPVFTYKKRKRRRSKSFPNLVGRRILHLFDDGEQEAWFRGRVLRVHRRSSNPRDTQFEVWYDEEPGTRYFLELLQDYEKGWLQLDV